MTLRARILTGFWWTAGVRFLGQMLTWVITIVVMRLLGPADYGLLAMATVFTSLLLLISELGLGPAIVQAVDIEESGLKRAFGVVLLMNGLLFMLLFLAAPLIALLFDEGRLTDVVRVLSVQFLFTAFTVLPEAMLQRELEFKRRALVELFAAIVASVGTLTLAVAGAGVWALVVGSMLGSLSKAIGVNAVFRFRHRPEFSVRGMRGLMFFGGNVTASRLLWFFYSQADILIAGKVLGKELLGYYSVSMHLASMPVQRISSVLNQVAFPAFARIQEDRRLVASHALKAIRVLSFVGFPLFFGVSSIAAELVGVILGEKWIVATLPLQLLTLVMPLRLLSNFLPSISDGVGRPDISLKNLILACLVMPIAFLVGSNWGLVGLSFAWIVAFPLVFISNVARCVDPLKLRVSDVLHTMARPALSSGCMYGCVLVAKVLLPAATGGTARLFALVAVGVLSYGLLVAAFDKQEAREIVRLLKS